MNIAITKLIGLFCSIGQPYQAPPDVTCLTYMYECQVASLQDSQSTFIRCQQQFLLLNYDWRKPCK